MRPRQMIQARPASSAAWHCRQGLARLHGCGQVSMLPVSGPPGLGATACRWGLARCGQLEKLTNGWLQALQQFVSFNTRLAAGQPNANAMSGFVETFFMLPPIPIPTCVQRPSANHHVSCCSFAVGCICNACMPHCPASCFANQPRSTNSPALENITAKGWCAWKASPPRAGEQLLLYGSNYYSTTVLFPKQ